MTEIYFWLASPPGPAIRTTSKVHKALLPRLYQSCDSPSRKGQDTVARGDLERRENVSNPTEGLRKGESPIGGFLWSCF